MGVGASYELGTPVVTILTLKKDSQGGPSLFYTPRLSLFYTPRVRRRASKRGETVFIDTRSASPVQRYLAHKKQRPPRIIQQDYA